MTKATLIGRLPLYGAKVYCVDKVILLPLSQTPLPEELKLHEVMSEPCSIIYVISIGK